jgi:hypothetical protein
VSKEEKAVDGYIESHNGLKDKRSIKIVVFYFLFQLSNNFIEKDALEEYAQQITKLCNYKGICFMFS